MKDSRTEPLDWNALRDLLVLAEEGSLSAAARRVGVAQSTMSRRLAAMENRCIRVLTRDAAGKITPTEFGEQLIGVADRMRASFAAAAALLAETPPPLRLASCEVTAQLLLADALSEWAARNPGQPVDHEVYHDLFSLPGKEWDIMVTPMEGPPPGTTGTLIGRITWALYKARDKTWTIAAGDLPLRGLPVVAAGGSLTGIEAYRWLETLGGQIVLRSSSPRAQLEACLRGQGIALLPRRMAASEARLEALGEVEYPRSPSMPIWLLATTESAGNPRVASFLRWARNHFRKSVYALDQG